MPTGLLRYFEISSLYNFKGRHLFLKKGMSMLYKPPLQWGVLLFRDEYQQPMSSCRFDIPEGGLPEMIKMMYNISNSPKFFNKCGNKNCCHPSHWSAIVKAESVFEGSDLHEFREHTRKNHIS